MSTIRDGASGLGSRWAVSVGAACARQCGAQPVVRVGIAADFQVGLSWQGLVKASSSGPIRWPMRRCNSILPPVPAPGACSTAAQERPISELPTRLSPSLPAPALPPGRAHCKAGPHAAVFFSPASPPSISVVREFWLRCPLLTLRHSSLYIQYL